ncbi:MAG: SDR family oxidoreductase [Chloroflexota bacterium]|nr:MAG: NAD(P)-dependent oxidoreductase [Chloroflexota bacterium]
MSVDRTQTLLVTGASGHLGRRVVELLLEAGAGPVIATTRTPEKLNDLAARGVTVRKADFNDAASLAQAFSGADRLLLISTDETSTPGLRLQQHRNAIKAAEEAGVRHVVYTSIVNPIPESPVFVVPDHRGTEEALQESGLGWTVLRNNIYADILLPSLVQAVQMGKLFSAAGDGKIGYVTREDCAHAAAAALRASFEGRRVLDITGPKAVSQAELAEIVTRLSGKTVTYVPIPVSTLVDNLVAAGLPKPAAEGIASFDAGAAQGLLDVAPGALEELTGRKPTSVEAFLEMHRDAIAAAAASVG